MKKNKKQKNKKHLRLSNSKLLDLILSVFRKRPSKKLNYKQISKALKIQELGVKIRVVDLLKEMAASEALEEVSRGSYRLVEKSNKIIATIKNTNRKGAYAETCNNNEFFISKENSLFALSGDEVEIFLLPKKKGRIEGRVCKVHSRKKEFFVGVIDSSSSNYFLIPDDRRIFFDVFIPEKLIKKSFLNKKVLVQIDSWNENYKNPVGKVIKVIGNINDHNSEINSILFDYGFNPSFAKNVEDSAKQITDVIPKKELQRRRDIRKTTTFTIDPKDAKDFDDALSVKKLEDGLWEVGVHIADVSYYVPEGSAIDKEAYKRGTSVYLVDRVIPMLPEVLSNDVCSLKPNVDRLGFSVFFILNERGNVLDYNLAETIIHSDFRFTYESAQKVISNKKGVFSEELLFLCRTSKNLRKNRQKKGSINFESIEVKFILDENNLPVDVSFKESLPTNQLIEEFMLLANKTIAKHVGYPKKTAKPFIYRVHDYPDNDKITALYNIVKKLGYTLSVGNKKKLSGSLNSLLKNVNGKAEQKMVETLTIRSMAKAIYTTINTGHYGLAFNYYSHFTSPIRRYPDLIAHRLLKKYFLNGRFIDNDDLESSCKHFSQMEKKAATAERDSIKYMQVKYLQNKIGKIYDGIISGVTEWGLYVEISSNTCEGLVKISSIKNDHYIYDEKSFSLIGHQTKKRYQLGQNVKIKIKTADLEKKQLDFILV